jgi:hypothetical protein
MRHGLWLQHQPQPVLVPWCRGHVEKMAEEVQPCGSCPGDGAKRPVEAKVGHGKSLSCLKLPWVPGTEVLSVASADDDGVVVGGDGLRAESGPADRWSAGLVVTLAAWLSRWRGAGHSVVTSVTAARAELSSTMLLLPANAAIRAWTARLLTARGSPRLTW